MIEEAGLDYIAAMLPINARSFAHITLIIFDTKNEPQARAAYDVARRLVRDAAKLGYGEYRAHLDFMDLASDHIRGTTTPTGGFCETLKDALDPQGSSRPASRGSGRGRCARRERTEKCTLDGPRRASARVSLPYRTEYVFGPGGAASARVSTQISGASGGRGWAVGFEYRSLDGGRHRPRPPGPRLRRSVPPLRRQLGVTSFGMNQIVLQPGQRGRIHRHERQEEVYLVLEGRLTLVIESEPTELAEQELIRVAPGLRRQLINYGPVAWSCSRSVARPSIRGATARRSRRGMTRVRRARRRCRCRRTSTPASSAPPECTRPRRGSRSGSTNAAST